MSVVLFKVFKAIVGLSIVTSVHCDDIILPQSTSTLCVCILTGSFRGMGAFYFKIEIEETSLTQHC